MLVNPSLNYLFLVDLLYQEKPDETTKTKDKKMTKEICKECKTQPAYDWAVELCDGCLEALEEANADQAGA